MDHQSVFEPTVGRRFQLELLGGFRLTADGVRLRLPGHARKLLAMVALGSKPMSRVYLAGTLWGETTEGKANSALRSALWRVRKHSSRIIDSSVYDLALNEHVHLDVRRLAVLAKRLIDMDDPCTDIELDPEPMSENLLPGWYEDWVLIERESLHQLFMHALEAMARRLTDRGETERAIQASLAAIAHEPLRESAHRTLIQIHIAEGNVGEALRHANGFSARLAEEWGAKPSPELQRIIDPLTGR